MFIAMWELCQGMPFLSQKQATHNKIEIIAKIGYLGFGNITNIPERKELNTEFEETCLDTVAITETKRTGETYKYESENNNNCIYI